jgi:hypothetical protein
MHERSRLSRRLNPDSNRPIPYPDRSPYRPSRLLNNESLWPTGRPSLWRGRRQPINRLLIAVVALLAVWTDADRVSAATTESQQESAPAKLGVAPADALPRSTDLRPTMQQWGLIPRVQGKRGTCSVFTMVGALEFAAARKQGQVSRLSVEFLNWASNKEIHEDQDGGFFSDLWKGFAAYGVCPEADLQYRPAFDSQLAPGSSVLAKAKEMLSLGLRMHWIKEWDVKTGLTDAQLVGIKRTLGRGWPVCGGFRWPKQAKWENDVLQMCPSDAVYDGHSVLVVGYRDEATFPGGGVLLFRNTAGDGHDGAMPYAYAMSFMNDATWVDDGSELQP